MGRISRASMFMGIARLASMRSTCMRLNVGAVIVHDNRPVSLGYNGAEAGLSHCAGNDCAGVVPGGCPTKHAEANAIDHMPREWHRHHEDMSCQIYCTDSPCGTCCQRIINVGYINAVYFERAYRDPAPLKMLWVEKIKVYEVTPAGYVVDYFSRQVIESPQ